MSKTYISRNFENKKLKEIQKKTKPQTSELLSDPHLLKL